MGTLEDKVEEETTLLKQLHNTHNSPQKVFLNIEDTFLSCPLILCSLTFSPPDNKVSSSSSINTNTNTETLVEKLIYVDNWRNKRFVIWAVCLPSALFGYFVPFVHLVEYAEKLPLDQEEDTNHSKASVLLACIAVTSGLGRLFFGKLSDFAFFTRNGNRI